MKRLFRWQNLTKYVIFITYMTAHSAAVEMSGDIKAQKFNLTVSLSEEPFGRKWKFV